MARGAGQGGGAQGALANLNKAALLALVARDRRDHAAALQRLQQQHDAAVQALQQRLDAATQQIQALTAAAAAPIPAVPHANVHQIGVGGRARDDANNLFATEMAVAETLDDGGLVARITAGLDNLPADLERCRAATLRRVETSVGQRSGPAATIVGSDVQGTLLYFVCGDRSEAILLLSHLTIVDKELVNMQNGNIKVWIQLETQQRARARQVVGINGTGCTWPTVAAQFASGLSRDIRVSNIPLPVFHGNIISVLVGPFSPRAYTLESDLSCVIHFYTVESADRCGQVLHRMKLFGSALGCTPV